MLDILQQVFQNILSFFITIPLDNIWAKLYVVLNAILQLFATTL